MERADLLLLIAAVFYDKSDETRSIHERAQTAVDEACDFETEARSFLAEGWKIK